MVTEHATGAGGPADFNITNNSGAASAIALVQQYSSTQTDSADLSASVKLADSHGGPISRVAIMLSARAGPRRSTELPRKPPPRPVQPESRHQSGFLAGLILRITSFT